MAEYQNRDPETSQYLKYLKKYARTIITVVVLIIILASSLFQIGAEEVGVVTRFGKHVRTVESGLKGKIPFVEKVYKVPV